MKEEKRKTVVVKDFYCHFNDEIKNWIVQITYENEEGKEEQIKMMRLDEHIDPEFRETKAGDTISFTVSHTNYIDNEVNETMVSAKVAVEV